MFQSPELQSFRLSPRTTKYLEALVREGDKFDYCRWLQRVREEEAEAKEIPLAFSSGESVAPETGNLTYTPDYQNAWANAEPALAAKSAPIPSAVYRSDRKADKESSKDRLRQRLMSVSDAWDDFQESRARDAVYKYLAAVFEVVVHYKGRRRTKRLLRRAFQFAGVQFDKNADPFAAVIRCTCEHNVDSKSISKWARALRYAAHCKVPRARLRKFMKELGGINGCAGRYARYIGRKAR
jgi:hypothetical protein